MIARSRIAIAVLCAATGPVSAQQPLGWHSTAEANASMLFGASSQTLTTMSVAVSHTSDVVRTNVSVKFRYGESENDERAKFVSARGWFVAAALDALPERPLNPFFSLGAESSLEKRIASRSSAGAGLKWNIAASIRWTASASLAVLAEHTVVLSDTSAVAPSLARWSWRLSLDRRVGERLALSHATVYGPIFNQPAQYTITSTSGGSYAINAAVAFTVTFTDNYDSQARARGAPSNNDGSLLFGVRGTF